MAASTESTGPVDVRALRDLMMRWVRGERSYWNEFNGLEGDPATVLAMCAVADAQEVVKLSAAIQALKGVAVTTTEPPVCHNPSCPISLFEHVEGHGECIPASAEPAVPGDRPSEWGHESMPLWEWAVSGVAYRSSPGSTVHDGSATGRIRAEGAGSVVAWLVAPGVDCPAWDAVDQQEEVTIVVRPVEDEVLNVG